MKVNVLLAALLLVVASAAPVGAAAVGGTQSDEAYGGAHVSFDTSNDAIVGYSVDGATVLDSVAVQSTERARAGGNLGADVSLKALTNFAAADVSVRTSFEASANSAAVVSTSSGAEMRANDNSRGILVISSGSQSQYVRANLSSDTEAEQSGDGRVVVTKGDGTQGAFLVVGDGEVTVNEDGNVTAQVQDGSKLVYRQYDDDRSDDDQKQEDLIASGTAAAEVYVQQAGESGSDGQQRAVNVVNYSEDTTVDVTEKSANRLNMTVERSQSQGKVVITTLSDQAFESAEDVQVSVDGKAAAKVDSYSAVESAATGGDNSAYLVRSSSSAQAATDVVVGIDHFSAREVSMEPGDGSGDGNDGGDSTDTDGQPGFGALGAIAALGAALLAAHRRSL